MPPEIMTTAIPRQSNDSSAISVEELRKLAWLAKFSALEEK